MTEDKKKNILITQDYDPLEGTGISVATFGIAAELVKLGCGITFATYNVPDEFAGKLVEGVAIEKLKTIADLQSEIDKADVIVPVVSFSRVFRNFGIAVGNLCEILNKPFFPWVQTTVQNSKFNSSFGVNDYVQQSNIFLMEQMFKNRACKKVICVSTAAADSVLSLGVDKDRVTVILNGLDVKKILSKLDEPSEKGNDVMCVQRLSPEKGNTMTVAVLANLKKLVPNFSAKIVGDGVEVGAVKSLIKVFGLEQNIELIPKLINGDCVRAIAKSKALLSTSFTESYGLAVAESMLVGTPVVVPDIEGPKELTEGGCGFTFDVPDTSKPAQILADIITGRIDTERIIQRAKNKIETECDVTKQAQKFYQILAG